MRIELNYEELISTIDDITTIVEDSSITEDSLKTIIFWVKDGEEVYVVGHSSNCLCKIKLEDCSVSNYNNELEFIQLKAKDFAGFLKSYSGMKETAVEKLYLEDNRNKILVTTKEVPIDLEDELSNYLRQTSYMLFDMIAMGMDRKREISLDYEEVELEGMVTKDIKLYLDNLSKLLATNSVTTNASKLYFGENHIFVMQSQKGYMMFIENTLRKEFKNITLSGAAVRFLSKFLTGNEVVNIGRTSGTGKGDNALVLSVDNIIVHLKYINAVPNITKMLNTVAERNEDGTYKEYVGGDTLEGRVGFINRDNAIVIHKSYILDVMKRFKLSDESMTVKIVPDKDEITFKNTKTSITLPLIMKKGMLDFGDVVFKVKPDRFEEWFIDDLDFTTKEAFMYFIQRTPNKYAVATLDSTGNWFCITNVAS